MAHNILGIDFGTRRVGVAVALDRGAPHRLMTLANDDGLMEALQEQVSVHDINTVVIGLPRNLDGEDTSQTAAVRAFAEQLLSAYPGVAVQFQDEALTSEAARTRLGRRAGSRIKGIVDQEAAVIILEDYIRGTEA